MKRLISLFIFFFTISAIITFDINTKQKLFQTINDQVNAKRDAPANYEKLITDLKSTPAYYFAKFKNTTELTKLQKSYGFGTTLLNSLKSILTKKAVGTIQVVKEQVTGADYKVVEFIGAAIYEKDGNVYIVLFKATTTGRVLKQVEIKTKRKCKKKFLHKKHCWNENYEVERKNTDAEIKNMKLTVQSKSLLGIKTKFYEENEKLHKEISAQQTQQTGGTGTTTTQDKTEQAIQAKKATFIENLEKMVDKSRKKPDGYDKLVRNIHSFTDVNMDMFNKNEVETISKKYALPDEVKNKLKTIAFMSQALVSQQIKYLNDKKQARIEEILGYVIKEQDTIFFAFIKGQTEGEIPYRTKNVSVKKCHRTLIGKSCHHEKKIIEDPYTAAELLTVKNALLAISSESLKNKLSTISESQILLGSGKIVSPDGKLAAVLGKNGKIYVGPAANPLSGTLFTIGTAQTESYAPYSLQVKENGNLYIINKNNDKVWTSNTANKGTGPFKLNLSNAGVLTLTDKTGKVIFTGKK